MLLTEIQNNQFFTSYKETKNWLNSIGIENYSIDPITLEVNVNGNVHIYHIHNLMVIPVKFKQVTGVFNCSGNRLTSLIGAPQVVGGDFWCARNELSSLKGSPINVGGAFSCAHNHLTTLEGAPNHIGGNFSCLYNRLLSLKGAPNYVGGGFSCHCNPLKSLQGAPSQIGHNFVCSTTNLSSLQGCTSHIPGNLICDGDDEILFNIHKFIKSVGNKIILSNVGANLTLFMWIFFIKSVKSLKINGGTEEHLKVCAIINKHLQNDRSGPACQIELIDAGLAKYIKL